MNIKGSPTVAADPWMAKSGRLWADGFTPGVNENSHMGMYTIFNIFIESFIEID